MGVVMSYIQPNTLVQTFSFCSKSSQCHAVYSAKKCQICWMWHLINSNKERCMVTWALKQTVCVPDTPKAHLWLIQKPITTSLLFVADFVPKLCWSNLNDWTHPSEMHLRHVFSMMSRSFKGLLVSSCCLQLLKSHCKCLGSIAGCGATVIVMAADELCFVSSGGWRLFADNVTVYWAIC